MERYPSVGQGGRFCSVIGSPDGQVRFGGKAYPLSNHGFVRDMVFEVKEVGEDFCTLQLRETPETLAQYPFPFTLTVKHSLLDQGFSTELWVKNTGREPMPFALGGHPGFACPMGEGKPLRTCGALGKAGGSTVLCLPAG